MWNLHVLLRLNNKKSTCSDLGPTTIFFKEESLAVLLEHGDTKKQTSF